MSRVIAGSPQPVQAGKRRAGGKSGLQAFRPHGLGAKGNAPDNVRGPQFAKRASAEHERGYGKCHRKYTAGEFDPCGRLSAKPRARLFRLSALGKGEKVG
jgi:hypothetical protein